MKKLAAAIAVLMILLFAIPLLLVRDKGEESGKKEAPREDLPIEVYMCDIDEVVTMNLEDYILGVVA